jgi:hypothetical protein
MMPDVPDAWSDEVRRAALIAVEIAGNKHRAAERALRYFLKSAIAHGLTLAEVAEFARLTTDEVVALTDPAVA